MKTGIITGIIILFLLVGDTYFRDVFQSIWLVLSLLFFVFLVVYQWLDRRNTKINKRNKEG